jgi:DNA-binding HxlR family transcriptional regulator
MARSYSCPVELSLAVLGGKWRVVILAHLKQQPLRYADLRRLAPRLSEKMLTQRLHELVAAGLVSKRGGRYALSALGRSAAPVLQTLYVWGERVAPELGLRIEGPAPSSATSRTKRW